MPIAVEDFIQHLEQTIDGIAPGSVKAATNLADIPNWDSLAMLNTMAMVIEFYSMPITGEEMMHCRTIGNMVAVLNSKLA